jgi:aspartyl-tRNA(Asn)/glutamyl-tRNA(Gln) amidotransferase subunit A
MSSIHKLGAIRLNRLFLAGELSAVEITRALLERIEALDQRVRAFLTVTAEAALERARKLDGRRGAGSADELGPLAGVPIALKDNICTKGVRTTCGSRILDSFVPPYDATVAKRLAVAGAILLGKTNMDEFAMGSSGENSAYFVTRNPWDLERVPGGSSSGSAAAVSAGEAPVTFGSDTGGSIRQPAGFCGVVGLKPTYGRVSRFGLVAFASSLDQIGPIAHDVADCAIAFDVIAGHDRQDSTSVQAPLPSARLSGESLSGTRLGVPKEYYGSGLHPGVRQRLDEAIRHLEALGAEIVEVSLPTTEYALSAYYIIAPAEASANLARFDGVRYGYRNPQSGSLAAMYEKTRQEGFGSEVKRRIMLGTYALSSGYYDAYYKKALQVRTLVIRDFEAAFAACDALVTPTAPNPAFRVSEKADDPLSLYLEDVLTIPVNLAGLPGLSLPCGLVDGLPVGMQLIGKAFDESKLLQIASAFERTTDHHKARPDL